MANARSPSAGRAMCSSSQRCFGPWRDPMRDDAALTVLAMLLADEPSGRLYKALVETKKAASVSGSTSGFAEAGFISFSAEVRQEQSLEDAKSILLSVLEDIKKNPPTEEEVARARTRLLKNFELSLKRSDQHRPAAQRIDRARRLAARLFRPRPARAGETAKTSHGWRRCI